MSSVYSLLPSVVTAVSELPGISTLEEFNNLISTLSATATTDNGVVYSGPFSAVGASPVT
jgi:hypothetical protein